MSKYFLKVFLVSLFVFSCKSNTYHLEKTEYKLFNINDSVPASQDVEAMVAPLRKHLEQQMGAVLAYNPEALTKEKDVLNAGIGNFMADACFEQIAPLFEQRTGKKLDFVLLNWGGIRSDLKKGDITIGSVFRLMPFENMLVVLEITGEKVNEMADYLARRGTAHPLSKQVGLQITTDGKIRQFTIHGKPIDPKATYQVCTSDFLMYGGDGMTFFANPINVHETDYLIRNTLIDYFKKIDTLQTQKDKRFIFVD
ncbi:5'-nucleotidase C-terminal domain-containing protein [Capnocytophaga canimorsus]|uniref:5'-nucleotidase C-terminal domain-containing protein n=1 Tax=Capnocytophaga canimorsus TaxID=28188 RepID=UPI0037CD440A